MKYVAVTLVFLTGLASSAFATTVDYSTKGSVAGGSATVSGSASGGSTVMLTSQLVGINSAAATGTVTLTTGTLVSTSNSGVFDFTGGTLTIASGSTTLFQGTFSSGTLAITGTNSFTISGTLANGAAFATSTNAHGDVTGNILTTPEPPTLAMLASGLIALAGLCKRRLRDK